MASGPAGPLGHLPDELQLCREPDGRGRLRPPPRPLHLPTRRSARCHFRSTTTTQSLWELLSYGLRLLLVTRRLHLQGRMPSTTLLNCGSQILSRVIRMPIGSESGTLSRRASPRYVTSLSAGRRPCRPTFWRATSRTSVSPSQTSRGWRVRVDYIQPTTSSFYSSVTRHCRLQGLTNPSLRSELFACYTTSQFASTFPCSCALGSCKLVTRRPLGTTRTTRTLRMLERIYWWIGIDVCTR